MTHSVLAVPVHDAGGAVVGVMELFNKTGKESFSAHDEALAAALLRATTAFVRSGRFYRQLVDGHQVGGLG